MVFSSNFSLQTTDPVYTKPENLPGDPLWHAFKNGDKASFARIYKEYAKLLLNYGNKVTSDKTVIEDSIQDLFVELWQNRATISETTSIKFYLFRALRYKICRNINQNEFRNFEDIHNTREHFDDASSIESFFIGLEVQALQMNHLKSSISQLPKRQQEAINLRYYHNFSNEEVAHIMGVNYQSACKFIYTALRKLKVSLRVSFSSFLIFLNFFSIYMD